MGLSGGMTADQCIRQLPEGLPVKDLEALGRIVVAVEPEPVSGGNGLEGPLL